MSARNFFSSILRGNTATEPSAMRPTQMSSKPFERKASATAVSWLSSGPTGYGSFKNPDILVRIDVTYLRQDFSMLQAVHDSGPWPRGNSRRCPRRHKAEVIPDKPHDAFGRVLLRT